MPDRVLIAGASGFAGAIAARLIDRHPHFVLGPVTSRSDVGTPLSELYPHHGVTASLERLDLDRHADVAAAIVAYPHGASAPLVAELRERGVRVIDLSADFRLRDVATYEHWYVPHEHAALIADAVYGMPELYRDEIASADLVAGPGCFPTAALLALAPLARAGLIADAVIDAKTGVSGAGRAATATTHFVSVAENMRAYGVGHHRHMPEIDQELALLGADVKPVFTPHLVPIDQGELISAYVTTDGALSQSELDRVFADAYASEPFVELVTKAPGVRDVRETNRCAVSVHADARTEKTIVFAAIDNLWKGTASQAIQCLNLMFGRPETEGLTS